MSVVRGLLLVIPFLLIAWFHWVRNIQQQQREKPRTSLVQRDSDRAQRACPVGPRKSTALALPSRSPGPESGPRAEFRFMAGQASRRLGALS